MSLPVRPSDTSNHPVLILDDEIAVLYSLRETLERAGYHVLTCNSPLKALELVRDRPFSVIITDMRMPEMNGLEFLKLCEAMRPDATRVLITAVLALSSVLEAINRGAIYRFIPKPWLHEELLAAVENSVQRFMLMTRGRALVDEVEELRRERDALRTALNEKEETLQKIEKAYTESTREEDLRHQRSLELCWRLLNTFDPELGARTRTIADLTQVFAASGKFDLSEQRALTTASWLCDLGLLASERGNPEAEQVAFRSHPVYSQTLAELLDDDELLAQTIRQHHEHFDGRGYPDGLAGEAICWTGRCLAVVAGFVESGLSHAEAEEFLLREAGQRFDPAAVRLFIEATCHRPLPRAAREILMEELRPGMVLSKGVYTPSGVLLAAEGQLLTPATIEKIRFHHKAAPPGQRLIVYS